MSTLRLKFKELFDVLSELNNPPAPKASLAKEVDAYLKILRDAQKKRLEEEHWRNLLAELVNLGESSIKVKLDQLPEAEFKSFCLINRIQSVKGRKEKIIKGKVIQKAVKATRATKKKPARLATPEIREPNVIIAAQTAREATTESIIGHVLQQKAQATT